MHYQYTEKTLLPIFTVHQYQFKTIPVCDREKGQFSEFFLALSEQVSEMVVQKDPGWEEGSFYWYVSGFTTETNLW